MRQQYDANPWGWDAAAKWSELAHDDARFVLVRGGGGAIQAFAHFRFDVIFDWERYEARTRTREALLRTRLNNIE